jgi:hypothetical protein
MSATDRLGTRVRFRDTGAIGDSQRAVEELTPFDGVEGPWHFVVFDDGLECWVRASSLDFLTAVGWI